MQQPFDEWLKELHNNIEPPLQMANPMNGFDVVMIQTCHTVCMLRRSHVHTTSLTVADFVV